MIRETYSGESLTPDSPALSSLWLERRRSSKDGVCCHQKENSRDGYSSRPRQRNMSEKVDPSHVLTQISVLRSVSPLRTQ